MKERRNRIIIVKRQTPKRVTLPNGRTFYAKYKRTTRAELPANVHLQRPYKQRAAPRARRRRRAGNVEEVSKAHLKKLLILQKKQQKINRLEISVEYY